MSLATDSGLLQALSALKGPLDELQAPSMIIGGIAVIARGVPRLTVDPFMARGSISNGCAAWSGSSRKPSESPSEPRNSRLW